MDSSVNSQLWKVWVFNPKNLPFCSPRAGIIWKHFWWALRCFVSLSVLLWEAILDFSADSSSAEKKEALKEQLQQGGLYLPRKLHFPGKKDQKHREMAQITPGSGLAEEKEVWDRKSPKRTKFPLWINGSKATLIPRQSPRRFAAWLS